MGAAPAERAFRAMLRSFGQIQRAMTPYFAARGVSASQWAVMRVLHRASENGEHAVRLTDLSERLLIKPPSVTGVIDRLQRDGLVARATQPDDLRVRRVTLTDKGRTLVDGVMLGHVDQIKKILAGLSDEELATLLALHEKITAHLASIQTAPGPSVVYPTENKAKPRPRARARSR